jgi:thiamine phosphate synthase YjbQ (UPF0047 family)
MTAGILTEGVLARDCCRNGFVNVLSRHTTTSICINENEARLTDDVRQYLLKVVHLLNNNKNKHAPAGQTHLRLLLELTDRVILAHST